MNELRDAYIMELQDLYDAEQQILQALPQMAQAASHDELRRALQEHEQQTRGQVRRLEQIFQRLGQAPGGRQCRIVQAMIQDGQEKLRQGGAPDTLDALIIATQQKIEHYEIAGYGTARSWAVHMNELDAAELLQQTADEEGETDKRLTRLAESRINREAMSRPRAAAA
ncbi:MAG: ferritin-like domain-containing protein [Armatimonadota bacterium]